MNQLLRKLPRTFLLGCCVTVLCSLATFAQEANDIKTGSVLFFNHYTSDPSNANREDTQINLTNTNRSSGIAIHLFAVDGSNCGVADSFLFLTANQTAQIFASDFDPGTRGYLVAVAFSGSRPIQFNFLTGTSYIHRADGKQADLPAVAVNKRSTGVVDNGDGSVSLLFNGSDYDRLPAVVAISNFNSQVTDRTTLYIYSPKNLIIGDSSSVSVFTLVFNELERSGSTSFRFSCYGEIPLVSLRVPFTLNGFIPAGTVGWMRMSSSRPLLGASLSRGPNFSGGRNLTCLSVFASWAIIVPGSA